MPAAFIWPGVLRGVPGETEESMELHSSRRNRAGNFDGAGGVDRGDANGGLSDCLLTGLPCRRLPPAVRRGVPGETEEPTPHNSG